ncbi:MAG TPA: methionine/alanine import family NSS transporter small subunit [Tissierellia bacterium]|nr:methionine/alanine import family NSS transporter small subunit [Tissierellia bacterium]
MSGAAIIFMLFGMIFLWGGFTTALITSSRRGKKFDY